MNINDAKLVWNANDERVAGKVNIVGGRLQATNGSCAEELLVHRAFASLTAG